MGWVDLGVSADYTHGNTQTSSYGDNNPIISSQFGDAFKRYQSGLYTGTDGSTNGANGPQQQSIDWLKKNLDNDPVGNAAKNTNTLLDASAHKYDPIIAGSAPLLGKYQGSEASTSDAAPMVNGAIGADYMGRYGDLFSHDVTDPVLNDYDATAANAYNEFRAGNAGAFGNKRTGVAEGQFVGDAARGRGVLESNLLTSAFNSAGTLGAGDAGRVQAADTTNAGNILNNNQFNANLLTQNSQFNAGNQNTRDLADQSATLRHTDQVASAIKDQAGLTQQQYANVVTANGVDLEAAQSLFATGAITQSQLETIMQAGSQYNGSSFTRNSDSTTDEIKAHVGAKI